MVVNVRILGFCKLFSLPNNCYWGNCASRFATRMSLSLLFSGTHSTRLPDCSRHSGGRVAALDSTAGPVRPPSVRITGLGGVEIGDGSARALREDRLGARIGAVLGDSVAEEAQHTQGII